MSVLELFCPVDDIWQQGAAQWQRTLLVASRRQRATRSDGGP